MEDTVKKSDKKVLCINSTFSGCKGIVIEKGTIHCDVCIEERKKNTQVKKELGIQELLQKTHELLNTVNSNKDKIESLERELAGEKELKINLENVIHTQTVEIQRLNSLYQSAKKENFDLVEAKLKYDTTYNQLLLDLKKYKLSQ